MHKLSNFHYECGTSKGSKQNFSSKRQSSAFSNSARNASHGAERHAKHNAPGTAKTHRSAASYGGAPRIDIAGNKFALTQIVNLVNLVLQLVQKLEIGSSDGHGQGGYTHGRHGGHAQGGHGGHTQGGHGHYGGHGHHGQGGYTHGGHGGHTQGGHGGSHGQGGQTHGGHYGGHTQGGYGHYGGHGHHGQGGYTHGGHGGHTQGGHGGSHGQGGHSNHRYQGHYGGHTQGGHGHHGQGGHTHGGHYDDRDHPTNPDQPTDPNTPTRPTPEAGDNYIRLGAIDDASRKGELSGADRPNPREISNKIADQDGKQTSNSNNASDLFWSWGQFIDHDMILTKGGEEKANISVPKGDPDFDPAHTGRSFVPFTRSAASTDKNGNREQINEQTALIDGSMVYGATPEKTEQLRSHEGGKLKLDENGHLLPDEKNKVLAGDPRAAEQPGLLALQTLFAKEHNRQAELITKGNPEWSDDKIFNEARRIVSNEIQAITYNEFLPTLLGGEAPVSSRVKYNPATVNGQVSSEFSTAAFRLGHTMVNETIAYKDKNGILKQAGLDEVFFKPEFTQKNGIASILSGMSEQKAQAVDPVIVDALRNRLFGPPQAGGPGMDLASLNIQRGRDHNIASYNDMREAMGYKRIDSFDDPVFQDGVGAKLAAVYDSPGDMDLWIGGLAENAYGNSMLGQTFTAIVDEQFSRTAAADPNFYARTTSRRELHNLQHLSLSDIIRANSDHVQIDDTAFIAE